MPVADADRIERKLTTILAADVEGYSRLMAADEVAAMAALKDARAVFARLIERHRGRIFTGPPSGVAAVQRGDRLRGHVDGVGELEVEVTG